MHQTFFESLFERLIEASKDDQYTKKKGVQTVKTL